MYEKYGIEKTIKSLDGVFAFVLYDKSKNKVMFGRDPYGVRPLFMGKTKNNELLICSEIKPISNLCSKIKRFPIGSFLENLVITQVMIYVIYYFNVIIIMILHLIMIQKKLLKKKYNNYLLKQ